MNKQTDALLNQISELSQQIRNKSTLKSDTLSGVLTDFRNTLERFEEAEAELRRQNQALLAARVQVEVDRRRYQEMFEFAPDAYLVTNPQGIIQEANQATAELLRFSPFWLTGRALVEFVAAADKRLFETLLQNVVRIHDIEICLLPGQGPEVNVSLTLSTVLDDSHNPVALHWIVRDITERKQAQAALDASERRFRAIFNSTDTGILLVNLDDRIVDSNPALQSMLGYAAVELRGRSERDLCFSHEESQWPQRVSEMRANAEEHVQFEKRFRAKDGQVVWASVSLSLLNSGSDPAEYVIGMVRNITSERQAAAELAEMRRRLLESAELERLRLAQELHDGPMQDLYGAIFQISEFHDPERQHDLAPSLDTLRSVAGTLRSICGELRPPTLSNLGLERAIRSHSDKLQDQHPELTIELHLSRDKQELPEQMRLALYRIYQQCMANVLRHAHASRVVVAFHLDEREVQIDVWDNGCGFTMPEKWVDLLRKGHYGLASVAERVQALGGTLQIESGAGGGTLVHVVVPKGK